MRKTLAAALLLSMPLCGTALPRSRARTRWRRSPRRSRRSTARAARRPFRKGGGYSLDDVACKDGQYDMVLDKDFKVVRKKKE